VGAKIRCGLPRCFIEVSVVVAAVHVLFPPPVTLARFAWRQPNCTAPFTYGAGRNRPQCIIKHTNRAAPEESKGRPDQLFRRGLGQSGSVGFPARLPTSGIEKLPLRVVARIDQVVRSTVPSPGSGVASL
jgi:hypothetical protein